MAVFGRFAFLLALNPECTFASESFDMLRIYKDLEDIKELLTSIAAGNKTVMNVDEAASYLKVSKSFLYKLTSSRKIPHYSPGKKLIFFCKAELDTWVMQNKVEEMRGW